MASGIRLTAKKDYARALLDFKNALKLMPKDAEVYYQLGFLAYSGLHQYGTAYTSFRKALSLDPRHTGAQVEISRILASTSNTEYLKDAEGRLLSLIDRTPANADALNTLALTELEI